MTVSVTGLRSTKGAVLACMSSDRKLFLHCEEDAAAHRKSVPAARELRFAFTGVAPGRYVIALLHDENGNGKVDRALGMMPTEGFGFSRDARVLLGPPSFDDAVVEVNGAPAEYKIRMRYMF